MINNEINEINGIEDMNGINSNTFLTDNCKAKLEVS